MNKISTLVTVVENFLMLYKACVPPSLSWLGRSQERSVDNCSLIIALTFFFLFGRLHGLKTVFHTSFFNLSCLFKSEYTFLSQYTLQFRLAQKWGSMEQQKYKQLHRKLEPVRNVFQVPYVHLFIYFILFLFFFIFYSSSHKAVSQPDQRSDWFPFVMEKVQKI